MPSEDPYANERKGANAGLNPMFDDLQHRFRFAPVPYADGKTGRVPKRNSPEPLSRISDSNECYGRKRRSEESHKTLLLESSTGRSPWSHQGAIPIPKQYPSTATHSPVPWSVQMVRLAPIDRDPSGSPPCPVRGYLSVAQIR